MFNRIFKKKDKQHTQPINIHHDIDDDLDQLSIEEDEDEDDLYLSEYDDYDEEED